MLADSTQVQQVIMNLATNARDAMPWGGKLEIALAVTASTKAAEGLTSPDGFVCLSIRDTGTGISPEVQRHVFEPFFTTKSRGEGTGLGLSTVYGIVKAHDGFIHVDSEIGRGSEFKVYLPITHEQVIDTQAHVPEGLPRGREMVLLAEDDHLVLQTGQQMLESLGYTVVTATNGVEAFEAYQSRQDEIALVLSDVTMPQMGGIELCQALALLSSEAKVLLISGYAMLEEISDIRAPAFKGIIRKPLDLTELATKIREVLDIT